MTTHDLERMPGIDERVGIREYENAIRVYRQILIEVAGEESTLRSTKAEIERDTWLSQHDRN